MTQKMVNNFELIKPLLKFNPEKGLFYFVQILKRRKDQPEEEKSRVKNASKIKTYWVNSLEYLEEKEEQIIGLCDYFNARAYIDLTPRTYIEVTHQVNLEVALILKQHNWSSIRSVLDRSAGKVSDREINYWVVDIDTKDIPEEVNAIKDTINRLRPEQKESKIVAEIPTVNGAHLITTPFELAKFQDIWPHITVQKNNPTLLYYGGNK